MTTNPPDEPAGSSWTWPTSSEDVPAGPSAPDEVPPSTRRLGWVILATGVVVMIAALLPWKTAGQVHVNGTAGDGILTLVFGFLSAIAGLGAALTRRQGSWAVAWPVVALTMAAFITLIGYTDVQSVAKVATVGIGLILTLVCGFGLIAASILALFRRT